MVGERVVGWLRGRPVLVDAVVAGVVGIVCGLVGLLVGAGGDYFVFTVALLAPVAVRRRWPEGSAAVVGIVALVQWVTVRDTTGAVLADVAVPIAVYTLAAHGRGRASGIGLIAGLGGAVLGGWSWPQLPMPALAHLIVGAFLASTVVAAWLGGAWQRARRGEFAALAERAALLETAHEQGVRLAVLSERTRIARDIHDILAHALGVIIAQADGGRYAARAQPERAVEALGAIGKQGREALGETRRAIGVLRAGPIEPAAAKPAPGLADLGPLVADLRAAGLEVALDVEFSSGDTDPGIGLLVYRIVQEALTNVVKHAGADARASVSVRREAEELLVRIADDGGSLSPEVRNSGRGIALERTFGQGDAAHGTPGHRSAREGISGQESSGTVGHGRPPSANLDESGIGRNGYGLIGMRERVSAYGGVLEFGRRDQEPGHQLLARIPLEQM
ncbi:sensor histidine kinase [Nocardia sp. NPDC057668]|uniref:sensor histidine kinase n=1 Tax=Nocardia sp. NPDC057668 TaxID=3346202 RepID=UPI0036708064